MAKYSKRLPDYDDDPIPPAPPLPTQPPPMRPPGPLQVPQESYEATPGGGGGSTPSGGSNVGGGGGGMPNWGGAGDPGRAESDFTWGVLRGIISGQDLPFGPEEINSEKAQAKTASENTFNQAKEQIQGQQAQTGFASSPAALRPIVEARIGASQQYGRVSNDITQNAAQQNFNARLSALQGAQSWMDSLRSYVATMTGSWWQRQQAMAQLALAQRQLDEQMRQFDISTGLNATL